MIFQIKIWLRLEYPQPLLASKLNYTNEPWGFCPNVDSLFTQLIKSDIFEWFKNIVHIIMAKVIKLNK